MLRAYHYKRLGLEAPIHGQGHFHHPRRNYRAAKEAKRIREASVNGALLPAGTSLHHASSAAACTKLRRQRSVWGSTRKKKPCRFYGSGERLGERERVRDGFADRGASRRRDCSEDQQARPLTLYILLCVQETDRSMPLFWKCSAELTTVRSLPLQTTASRLYFSDRLAGNILVFASWRKCDSSLSLCTIAR